MIPKPYTIPYVPNPHRPRYSQQQPQPAPEVPLAVFRAAVDVNATHLSADGLRAWRDHYGNSLVCFWDDEARNFGSWFPYLSDLPGDAVKVDG